MEAFDESLLSNVERFQVLQAHHPTDRIFVPQLRDPDNFNSATCRTSRMWESSTQVL